MPAIGATAATAPPRESTRRLAGSSSTRSFGSSGRRPTRRAPNTSGSSTEGMSSCQTPSPTCRSRLRSDQVEYLVALAFHQLLRARLEVQAQQRLGVRRADVEVPVVRVDRDAVEVRDLALGRVPLLQFLQLDRNVGDGRVQLTREEVARAVRLEDLRQLAALLRDELEHEQERYDAGVRLRELSEVVVTRDLAAECRVVLAHAVLDEGVPDAVDERHASGAFDRLRHRPARTHVVDDLR